MSDSLPAASLPAVTVPEVSGALAKASRGSLSSEMEFTPTGMAIKTLEQGMQLAKYLVAGGAAPKGWTDAQVFLAMQAGLEHGLGYTGGIQSFVIINNMPSWRGQAAIGKIRASKVLQPGTLEFGCEEHGAVNGVPALRGWCRARRIGDHQDTTRYFTQQDAIDAGLWSAGANWSKFRKRMLMWRAVGFLTKDLFSDVLGNFPIAEELFERPEDDNDAPIRSRVSASVLATTIDAPSTDPLLAELSSAKAPTKEQILEVVKDKTLEESLRLSVQGHKDAQADMDRVMDIAAMTDEEREAAKVAAHEARQAAIENAEGPNGPSASAQIVDEAKGVTHRVLEGLDRIVLNENDKIIQMGSPTGNCEHGFDPEKCQKCAEAQAEEDAEREAIAQERPAKAGKPEPVPLQDDPTFLRMQAKAGKKK